MIIFYARREYAVNSDVIENGSAMSVGDAEPKNPNAADYKIYARLDAGESLDSIIANPPTTKYGRITCESNIRQEYGFWKRWRKKTLKK